MTTNFWAPMPRLVGPVHATLPRGSVNGDSALQHDAKELEPPEHPQQIPLCWCIRHTHTVQCEWPNKLKELRKRNWVEAALKTSDHTESLLAFRITFMLIHTPLHSSLQATWIHWIQGDRKPTQSRPPRYLAPVHECVDSPLWRPPLRLPNRKLVPSQRKTDLGQMSH